MVLPGLVRAAVLAVSVAVLAQAVLVQVDARAVAGRPPPPLVRLRLAKAELLVRLWLVKAGPLARLRRARVVDAAAVAAGALAVEALGAGPRVPLPHTKA